MKAICCSLTYRKGYHSYCLEMNTLGADIIGEKNMFNCDGVASKVARRNIGGISLSQARWTGGCGP